MRIKNLKVTRRGKSRRRGELYLGWIGVCRRGTFNLHTPREELPKARTDENLRILLRNFRARKLNQDKKIKNDPVCL